MVLVTYTYCMHVLFDEIGYSCLGERTTTRPYGAYLHLYLFKGPLVLSFDFLFFFWSEIILDVEGFSNFLRAFALDHIGNLVACEVQEWLDVEIVCSEDELKESSLINIGEFFIPLFEIITPRFRVLCAVFDDFRKDLCSNIW